VRRVNTPGLTLAPPGAIEALDLVLPPWHKVPGRRSTETTIFELL